MKTLPAEGNPAGDKPLHAFPLSEPPRKVRVVEEIGGPPPRPPLGRVVRDSPEISFRCGVGHHSLGHHLNNRITPVETDLTRLFKLRAAVGRFGEMDKAGWWNTEGVLGSRGAAVYKRGLPWTHFLARVRVVVSVARERSNTIYPSPGAATLWNLPPALERALSFQERAWAIHRAFEQGWREFESELANSLGEDLVSFLTDLGLVKPGLAEKLASLSLAAGGRGVEVPGPLSDEAIQLLALAHSRGGERNLIVPFIADASETADG